MLNLVYTFLATVYSVSKSIKFYNIYSHYYNINKTTTFIEKHTRNLSPTEANGNSAD